MENKSRLSNDDFQNLLTKLKTEKVNSAQALEILRLCSFAHSDQNLKNVVYNIWNELKKENDEFQVQHYNYILNFARDRQDVERAQAIFDELIKDGVKPNV